MQNIGNSSTKPFDQAPKTDPMILTFVKALATKNNWCKSQVSTAQSMHIYTWTKLIQGDPKKCVPMKISIVTLIKKLFISNYNHTLFSLWKTIH